MRNTGKLKKGILISQIVSGIAAILFFTGCAKEKKHAEWEKSAKTNCASCHMYPDPSILPRKVWGEKVLPNMGYRMGMSHGPIYTYGDPDSHKDLNPTMPQEEWDKIVHYYLNESVHKIPIDTIQHQKVSALFKPHVFLLDSLPLITMTSYDEKTGNLFLGNASSSTLLTLDTNGAILNSDLLESAPVKIVTKDSLNYMLMIGSLNPSDEPKGKLKIGDNVIEGLIRPVDFLIYDINLDGYDDVFVCNYGNNIGDFSLFENLRNGTYKKRVIHPLSGAIKVEVKNMDADEANEIVVLFAQEHESIMIWDYKNDTFIGKKAIQFQPAFGSVDFQLKDMNGDGLTDIIIGNGDNSDLSTVLKNFHGVRVLLNNGNKEFSEDYFYPFHGVSKIEADDFDLDGDTDILAISNFGDFSNPNFKSVQLLLNEGGLRFEPKYIDGLPDFRWQTIDVSDYDKDGDLDVFIGSFNLNVGPKESDISERKNVSWVKLENTLNN
ncbi:FG-GAP repeat domain-containing protein [Kriegella aquimaris]|uniref:Repeat domain-containing protein n=1 Tax=Kriegella aquimaris TaxID=192904 RepID=A0A1G9S2R2_9FLAO|nr:VCBS repeat-containing protein [Kriegella aquimaris]SDM29858.1 Repeat domain-containing protein [Kriegella aquimaris]